MRCLTYEMCGRMHVRLNRETLGEVVCFKYQGSQVDADGGCRRDVKHQMNEVYKASGALRRVLSNRGLEINANKRLGVVALTELYRTKEWGTISAGRRKVNVLELKCLRISVGVSRTDRVRNGGQ